MKIHLKFTFVLAMATLMTLGDVSCDGRPRILRKRDAPAAAEAGGPSKSSVAIPSSVAQEFLAKLSRTKRNLWDRDRPDVQQWIQQFFQMGFDQQRLEADLSYWRDHARANDHGRQHHYDENAPVGPRDATSYRHGANVNYDYY